MKISKKDLVYFRAGDDTQLCEVLHPKNHENLDIPYSIAHAKIDVNQASLVHTLEQKELYIFTKGIGIIYVDEAPNSIEAGDLFLVPEGASQYVKNTGNEQLTFYCIVSPPWSEQGEQVG